MENLRTRERETERGGKLRKDTIVLYRILSYVTEDGGKMCEFLLLVAGNDVCDHPIGDARAHVLSQSDVALQLLDSQSLVRIVLVLLLQL